MAGIYIHIPFCKRRCHYCNFYSLASSRYMNDLLETIPEEFYLQTNYMGKEEITTIYFGGGTPSLVPASFFQQIIEQIRATLMVTADPEVTLEANPDDITPALLHDYRKAGINRLSLGVQSFFADDLEYLNRIHSAARAEEAVREAQEAGFDNLSIDLIYGIPTLTEEKWRQNLEKTFALNIPHVSAYALTVEPKTALDLLIQKKRLPAPEEEQTVDHFNLLLRMMKPKGYDHYEISNFSLPGFQSRHNCQYWSGAQYLGLGPSAHSFNGHSRQWNVSSVLQYIDQIRRNEKWFEMEELTVTQQYNEFVMVNLRTMWGCDTAKIRSRFGEQRLHDFITLAVPFLKDGKITEANGVYYLTDKGKLYADGIAAALFAEE